MLPYVGPVSAILISQVSTTSVRACSSVMPDITYSCTEAQGKSQICIDEASAPQLKV
jgi:hypothetical protein